MMKMKFPESWIKLIIQCVSTVSYQVLINGSPGQIIIPSQGLRQGDPLSPYLYILCANVLSCMINQAEFFGWWKGIKISRQPDGITHLMYADDTLLFCKATEEQCKIMKALLNRYNTISGQHINFQKSVLVCSPSVSHSMKKTLASMLGVKFHSTLWKYLGTYIDENRRDERLHADLLHKIDNRLAGWKSSFYLKLVVWF